MVLGEFCHRRWIRVEAGGSGEDFMRIHSTEHEGLSDSTVVHAYESPAASNSNINWAVREFPVHLHLA